MRNAYNEIKRAKVLQRLNAQPHLQALVPVYWATYETESDIYWPRQRGLERSDFPSAEGMQQGDPFASAGFCVGIHPEVLDLDGELQVVGGFAKFDMDDGYAVGPADHVFPAVTRFGIAVQGLGLELQVTKCECFSPQTDLQHHPARPVELPVGSITLANGTHACGIEIGGTPLGDEHYVQAYLDGKAADLLSKFNTVSNKLRDRHSQSLYTITYYSFTSVFQYWLQHCYPVEVQQAARRVDNALFQVAQTCIPGLTAADELTMRRLQLPARCFGGGLRSMEDVAPAAFLGTLCKSLPKFLNTRVNGYEVPGFLHMLAPVLGERSFERHHEDQRFATFLQSGTPMAHAMASAWAQLQREVGGQVQGPLAMPAVAAGRNDGKLQKALTKQRELTRFQQLDVALRSLPQDDMRAVAWTNLDKFSTTWVAAWPDRDACMSNAEFAEVTATYFGLPSPACQHMVGERIASLRTVLDPYGCRLAAAQVPGDGWRTQHNALKWRISQDMREMHMRATTEVYGLFAPLIPQAGRSRLNQQPARKRQGLVPDFLIHAPEGPSQAVLLELKTLHFGTSTYPAAAERCAAVARRARTLPGEYARKAQTVDIQYCGCPPGELGPVARKLMSYGRVRGLVFGAWGEASPDAHQLLNQLARQGARHMWRDIGSTDEAAAVGCLAWLLRRRWGMAALRENARLKLDRLAYVGRGAAEAAERRQRSELAHALRARLSRAQQGFTHRRR